MSLTDIFKIKKFKEDIKQHLEDNSALIKEIETLNEKISLLLMENVKYKSVLTNEHSEAIEIKELIEGLEVKKLDLNKSISNKQSKSLELENNIKKLNQEIIELNDEVLYQSFGLYTPLYDFANSDDYKNELKNIRILQKQMIKDKTAVTFFPDWTVDGSKAKGRKMTNDNIQQIIRSFNSECEYLTDRVKFNNYESIQNRITKAFETLNKLNETNMIEIEWDFLNLKYQELNLAYEYKVKKQEEKDEQKVLAEKRREDAKVAKEIEARRKDIEKEKNHYNNVLKRLDEQISVEKIEERLYLLTKKRNEIENNLIDLDLALKEVDYREANQRAGYVYIISNIGTFGKDIYKIGMTRRLNPQDRIDELGSASVPFRYDTHAMIFTDDAPKLENALHKAFENKRLNMINRRKEFFNIRLEEIEEVVKANHDKTVEFVRSFPAQQYRESVKKRDINIEQK